MTNKSVEIRKLRTKLVRDISREVKKSHRIWQAVNIKQVNDSQCQAANIWNNKFNHLESLLFATFAFFTTMSRYFSPAANVFHFMAFSLFDESCLIVDSSEISDRRSEESFTGSRRYWHALSFDRRIGHFTQLSLRTFSLLHNKVLFIAFLWKLKPFCCSQVPTLNVFLHHLLNFTDRSERI